MRNRVYRGVGSGVALLLWVAVAGAQTSAPAPAAVPINLADPQAALGTYFLAQKANDLTALNKSTMVSAPEKKNYVDFIVSYQMWARYLERQAIAKFGKEDGLKVQGHLRSLDDQTDLDIKRARDANVEYNTEKTTAKLFLRIERGRPDNLQTDRFQFIDVYYLAKTAAGWQVDFLKTYKCLDPDQEETYRSEMGAFPRMTRNIKKLAEDLKAGRFKTVDDLKNTLEAAWAKVYDEPTDASGRTAAETQAAGAETQPAPAQSQPAAK